MQAEKVETALVGSQFSDIRQRYVFVSGRFFWKQLKARLVIVISAKNDLIQQLFPGNKPIIDSFKGGGGVG